MRFPIWVSDSEVLSKLEEWVDLLAEQNFQAAFEWTAHDNYYGWTPCLIEKVIGGYGLAEDWVERKSKVSKVSLTSGGPTPRWGIERLNSPGKDGLVGSVWIDLPLNGAWSDLSTTFGLYEHKGQLFLVLNEIHVF